MDYLICKNCQSFTINRGIGLECTNCGCNVAELHDGDDILLGIQYTSDLDMLSGTGYGMNTLKRMSTNPTCPIVEDKICPKCKSFCRYVRMGNDPMFVCSNGKCRNIVL